MIMTTKNKVSFALFSTAVLLIALAAIGGFRLGLSEVACGIMYSVAFVLMDISLILWIGISRFLRYFYMLLVLVAVIFCIAIFIVSDNILVWIGSVSFAIIAVASLVPVVFKSK